ARDLRERNHGAPLGEHAAEQLPVAGEHARDLRRVVALLELLHAGDLRFVARHREDDRERETDGERDAADGAIERDATSAVEQAARVDHQRSSTCMTIMASTTPAKRQIAATPMSSIAPGGRAATGTGAISTGGLGAAGPLGTRETPEGCAPEAAPANGRSASANSAALW